MSDRIYKNDYLYRKYLKDFANRHPVGKLLKPFLRALYLHLNQYLPYPRDFLLRRIPQQSICCEIGVYEGVFSERILRIANPAKLYLVDPWVPMNNRGDDKYSRKYQDDRFEKVVVKFSNHIEKGSVVLVKKTSDEAVYDFTDAMFNFVYIDGDHSYEQVRNDLVNYYPKVKYHGMLCGDDYDKDTVRRAVDEFVAERSLSLEVRNRQFVIMKEGH